MSHFTYSYKILLAVFILCTGVSGYARLSDKEIHPAQKSWEDSIEVIITQSTTYLFPGQEIEIKVFSTCNTRNKIERIEIGGAVVPLMKEGVAVFKVHGGSLGVHEIPVDVVFADEQGTTKRKHYSVQYTVGQVNACIALDKMNVLYTGIDNIVWIAVTGAGDEKLAVSVSGKDSRIQKLGSGKYNVRVSAVTDECFIDAYVDGKIVLRSQYRVRSLPAPTAAVNGYKSGDSLSINAFLAQAGVMAYLKDFPFELKYEMISYCLSMYNAEVKRLNVKGAAFTAEVKKTAKEFLEPGSTIIIDSILVKDSGGRMIKVPALIYYMK